MVQVKEDGANVTYTRFNSKGHDIAEYAYNNELLEWLLSKKRSEVINDL